MEKIEAAFDNENGEFVFHVSGAASHEEEHKIVDELIIKLEALGFKATKTVLKDDHKLSKTEKESDAGKLIRIR